MWRKGNLCALLVDKLVQPLWKTVWRFLKKLKIELSYDPAVPLLGIYPKETKTLTRKISACICAHTMELLFSHKKRVIAIFDNMGGPWGHYAKWNKSEKFKYGMISLICGILKKRKENKTQTHQYWLVVGRGSGCSKMSEGGQKAQTSSYK